MTENTVLYTQILRVNEQQQLSHVTAVPTDELFSLAGLCHRSKTVKAIIVLTELPKAATARHIVSQGTLPYLHVHVFVHVTKYHEYSNGKMSKIAVYMGQMSCPQSMYM